jgi:hypothetical protein
VFQKYRLQPALNCLIDPSDKSPKFLDETRASSLLRRALSWCLILKALITPDLVHPSLMELFSGVSASDSSAAQWLLQRMDAVFKNKEAYKQRVLDFHLAIMCGDHSGRVITSVTLNVARLLEDALDYRAPAWPNLSIKWTELKDSLLSRSQRRMWGREMADADLRLHSCLLTFQFLSLEEERFSTKSVIDIRGWLIKLYSAIEDVIVSKEPSHRCIFHFPNHL